MDDTRLPPYEPGDEDPALHLVHVLGRTHPGPDFSAKTTRLTRIYVTVGFLYDPISIAVPTRLDLRTETQEAERDRLPIGFAVENDFSAEYAVPPTANHTKVIGLSCSGCHSGRIDVEVGGGKTYGYLIDGGSGMINLGAFQDAVGRSLAYTLFFRDRFNQFSARVLGNDSTDAVKKTALEAQVRAYVTTGIAGQNYAKEHKLNPVEGGFSRTDALGLIGNRVFGPLNTENQSVTDAPVNFPHLWDTAWFDWVQYNASIRLPMARNIGEALGVGAAVKLGNDLDDRLEYTVNVKNLDWMERFLGGDEPFASYTGDHQNGKIVWGLLPPRWDDFAARCRRPSRSPATRRTSPASRKSIKTQPIIKQARFSMTRTAVDVICPQERNCGRNGPPRSLTSGSRTLVAAGSS